MTASQNDIVIVDGARTPMGGFQGDLSAKTGPELGSVAVAGSLSKAKVSPDDVDNVIMGCVLPAGMGQAPARQAAHGANIPWDAGCTTVNKMCGSGMQATIQAHDALTVGSSSIVVAGGLESMSNTPYLLPKARDGYRMGHNQVLDHMFTDGLEDTFDPGRLMGTFAEDTAQHFQFTREAQDEFAITSLTRAQTATADGTFDREIVPVTVETRKSTATVTIDEQPANAKLDKIPKLRPAFREHGTVTAANSSSISDGAAALVLMRADEAERRGLTPRARIAGHAAHAQEPAWFTTAPIFAIKKLLDKTGWDKADVDLFEVNEAFAVVTMAAMRDLDIPHDKMNIHGGACALGHPVGASGARIIIALLNGLEKRGVDKGVAAICIGGGEATAIAIERLH